MAAQVSSGRRRQGRPGFGRTVMLVVVCEIERRRLLTLDTMLLFLPECRSAG